MLEDGCMGDEGICIYEDKKVHSWIVEGLLERKILGSGDKNKNIPEYSSIFVFIRTQHGLEML